MISLNNHQVWCFYSIREGWLVGCLCFTSHRQQGHIETEPLFTVPCEGSEVLFLHRSHRESNPGSSRGNPLHYCSAMPAPPIREGFVKGTVSYENISYLNSVWINLSVTTVKVFLEILVAVLKHQRQFLLAMQHVMKSKSKNHIFN